MAEFLMIILVIPAIAYIIVNRTLCFFSSRAELRRRRERRGIEAQGILLSMQETGIHVNSLEEVKLQIQVQPKLGRNFVTETKELVSRNYISSMRSGSKVTVRYNPTNLKEVFLIKDNNMVYDN